MTHESGADEPFACAPVLDSPTAILAHVTDLAPDLYVLALLESIDASTLTHEDAITYLHVHDRVQSWWASKQNPALLAATGPSEIVSEFLAFSKESEETKVIRIADCAREEISSALRWSPAATQGRIDRARILAGPLRPTQAAISLGEITPLHAIIMCESAERLSSWIELQSAQDRCERDDSATHQAALILAEEAFATDTAALQALVLPAARKNSVGITRARANKAVDTVDANGKARRREAVRKSRGVYLTRELDGMSTLIATLESGAAQTIMSAVNAAAQSSEIVSPCETELGARKADALVALILGLDSGRGASSTAPIDLIEPIEPIRQIDSTRTSASTPINLNISVELALAISEIDSLRVDCGPGGLGSLLADPAVKTFARPIAVDPQGHVLDVGRKRYQITGALRTLITTRDGTCRFPQCTRPATQCQIDHAIAWDDGGPSDVDNLGVLCLRHHQLKTHGGWQLTESKPDGSCTWTSPAGRTYYTIAPVHPAVNPSGDAPASPPAHEPAKGPDNEPDNESPAFIGPLPF